MRVSLILQLNFKEESTCEHHFAARTLSLAQVVPVLLRDCAFTSSHVDCRPLLGYSAFVLNKFGCNVQKRGHRQTFFGGAALKRRVEL